MSDVEPVAVRPARPADTEAVRAFTQDTWEDGDYVADAFPEWARSDAQDRRTLVATLEDDPVGVLQVVLLSEFEAWCQAMRVHPEHRDRGIGTALTRAAFRWARERGATVARNMVFSSNKAGIAHSRTVGFEPVATFRWARPAPAAEAAGPLPDATITDEPAAGWSFWQHSPARDALDGLALHMDESWALNELTYERLDRAAEDTALLVLQAGGTRGLAYRTRTYEREAGDGDPDVCAEYGVGAWADADAAAELLAAIRRDAAGVGAHRVRVLLPETPRAVSDAALAGAEVSDEPDFVFAADLTDPALTRR